MATTINTYLARVKLLTAATLADLEKAVNDYIDDDLETGEYAMSVDIDEPYATRLSLHRFTPQPSASSAALQPTKPKACA